VAAEQHDFRDSTMEPEQRSDIVEWLVPLAESFRWLLIVPVTVGALALGATYAIQPTFTATLMFMPPLQQQSQAASALASLGALANLTGGAASRAPSDQYVALMESVTISDRIIERFDLIKLYEADFRVDARRDLSRNTRFSVGKKDGLIRVEVDDTDPARAAKMANAYLEELRKLSATLAITEAQQRRSFFENQLKLTREQLGKAQELLSASGISQGALRAEPKAAAEAYARLRAEVTAAAVKLQALRQSLADGTPEVAAAQSVLASLQTQLQKAEQTVGPSGSDADYISRFREFKYQETLFDLFARQYELARVDEAREGALFQVVDPSTPPERKSKPRRLITAALAGLAAFVLMIVFVSMREAWRRTAADPTRAGSLQRLRNAWSNRP
jgi:uncharacterized protein involved in exopolysaccharide biosynthesis